MVQMHQLSGDQRAPLVVKLGGSLHHNVPDIVPLLSSSTRPLLVVPGGGFFADAVRQAQVTDDVAHWMAIAAMGQFGWYIASREMLATERLSVPEKTVIFLPYVFFREHDPLPHSWDVTSDSIAAWVAAELDLELLLLKSVDGISINGVVQEQVTTDVRSAVTDPFFIQFVLEHAVITTIINGKEGRRVEKFLKG